MSRPVYTFARGATLLIGVTDSDAAPGGESAITCRIKPLRLGAQQPVAGSDPVADLTVTYRAATEDVPRGWTFVLGKDASAELAPGQYQLDFAVLVSATRIISRSAKIVITEPSSL